MLVRDNTIKPIYIFNLTLTSSGIIVHKNQLPTDAPDEIALPIDQITFDREIEDDTFAEQTRAIFEYSQRKNCRFYVQVLDKTGPNEKDTYKKRLQAVESHFYKLSVASAAPTTGESDQ